MQRVAPNSPGLRRSCATRRAGTAPRRPCISRCHLAGQVQLLSPEPPTGEAGHCRGPATEGPGTACRQPGSRSAPSPPLLPGEQHTGNALSVIRVSEWALFGLEGPQELQSLVEWHTLYIIHVIRRGGGQPHELQVPWGWKILAHFWQEGRRPGTRTPRSAHRQPRFF